MKRKLLTLLLMISLIVTLSLFALSSCGEETPDSSSVPSSSTNDSTNTTESSKPTTESTNGSSTSSTTGNSSTTGSSTGPINPPQLPEGTTYPTGYENPVIQYVRIGSIGANTVTVRFNATGKNLSYEIRYSREPITEENFGAATLATGITVTGNGEVKTATLNLNVGNALMHRAP